MIPLKLPRTRDAWLRWAEWSVASLMGALIVVLHVANMKSAGALWRDEAAAVHLALMPSFGAIWSHLEHESFPLLLTALLRTWNGIGLGGSDLALRGFGLLVGLSVLAALWWNAWRFSSSPPIVSMLLFGLSPTTIRWGDSLRAYGLGALFILLTLGLVWNVLRSPSARNVAFAMIAGIFSVQALYQNGFILAAICLSGAAVALRRRAYKRALIVVSIALPAAFSLLPYIPVVQRANEWNVATQVAIGLPRIWTVLHRALNDPGPLMLWLWFGFLVAAIAMGVVLIVRRRDRQHNEDDADLEWFLLAVMIATTVAYYIFLKLAKFPTETWYYLVWMALIAVAIDGLIARAAANSWRRAVLIIAAVVAGSVLLPGVWRRTQVRMTNLDLVAQQLNQKVAQQDLVLVHPWFCGATFHRYYTGSAEWTTLPPLRDYGLQRLDIFKRQLQEEDPIQPVLEKMEGILRNGGTIWLVGHFPFSSPPQPAPRLPRPGEGPEGWRGAPYMMAYGMQATYFLQKNALQSAPVEIPLAQAVNPFENLPLRTISGWRRRY